MVEYWSWSASVVVNGTLLRVDMWSIFEGGLQGMLVSNTRLNSRGCSRIFCTKLLMGALWARGEGEGMGVQPLRVKKIGVGHLIRGRSWRAGLQQEDEEHEENLLHASCIHFHFRGQD